MSHVFKMNAINQTFKPAFYMTKIISENNFEQ